MSRMLENLAQAFVKPVPVPGGYEAEKTLASSIEQAIDGP